MKIFAVENKLMSSCKSFMRILQSEFISADFVKELMRSFHRFHEKFSINSLWKLLLSEFLFQSAHEELIKSV